MHSSYFELHQAIGVV